MIYNETLIQVNQHGMKHIFYIILQFMFAIHFPPVSKKLVEEMLEKCEEESNNKDLIKKRSFSPFLGQIQTNSDTVRKQSTDSQRGKKKDNVREYLYTYRFFNLNSIVTLGRR